ncbi:putative ATP dependent DEAD H RNA helicase [Trypanosoma vivax]|uniref:ATP-dependent RNA helicase n=1 Tax=Trypanosoma vivax (strain Y486) TaxID=1055687 RepID=G0TR62_TRYVY|nr:putative ATP-dependent RNA helicase [Trypanosoma vivax]KAH8611219.1 putative ATP dependent DEAD H RNA helicase [Trypanosoma vivax]CCC46426.1 putative ATP-dependent RNA helicase [Trypanosoma vivax Y486]
METCWDTCLGANHAWLLKPLKQQLHYERPLPVQQAVVPTLWRALRSGLPMDVCLTAPTGSGKTLCYLLPLLQLVAEAKKGADHSKLLALILVPTKALGQQVAQELRQLAHGTSITTVSLCDDCSLKEEATMLVRTINVVPSSFRAMGHSLADEPTYSTGGYAGRSTELSGCTGNADMELEANCIEVDEGGVTRQRGAASLSSMRIHFSCANVVVATPQRLLSHLDGTVGIRLADLRLLVIDEADQVLASNFANFLAKVVERFEEEQVLRLGNSGDPRRLMQLTYSLHKVLCSATLSTHIARISEVRLRNCRHFTLDSFGTDIRREDEGQPVELPTATGGVNRDKRKHDASRGRKRCHSESSETCDEDEHKSNKDLALSASIPRRQLLRTSFALPPRLQEHVIFVEDWYRHAALLKLIRVIIAAQNQNNTRTDTTKRMEKLKEGITSLDSVGKNDGVCGEQKYEEAEFCALGHQSGPKSARRDQQGGIQPKAPSGETFLPSDDDAGKRIIVFCRSADEARVMGHFLLSAGVRATEFTTLASEGERRRALLKSQPDSCIVASDALMRGVDVPNVGHVIMYSAPETLSQYVHRAGRTARAMRAGHLYLLLQKNGPSGTQLDGEVATFKALSATVSRSQAVRYERHFFKFDTPPSNAGGGSNVSGENEKVKDSALLLVEEADGYLRRTQARLSGRWLSALEATKRGCVSGVAGGENAGCGDKKEGPLQRKNTSHRL